MIETASFSLQAAIYDALRQDTDVQGLLGNPPAIYDAIPEEAAFPLLEIGGARTMAYAGVPGGLEHRLRINAYSRWGGRKECKAIAEAVRHVLTGQRLLLLAFDATMARLMFSDTLRTSEPGTFQVAMRYRVVTTPKAGA